MDLKLLFDSFRVTWDLFWGPLGLLRASGRLLGSELLPGADLRGSVSVQGFILGALGVFRAPFWELWDPSGSIFGSFGRLRRLLGALGEAPRAPRAAWMSPGGDFGSQIGRPRNRATSSFSHFFGSRPQLGSRTVPESVEDRF